MRKHKVGTGNGPDQQLRDRGRLLSRCRPADSPTAYHHHGHNAKGEMAAGAFCFDKAAMLIDGQLC